VIVTNIIVLNYYLCDTLYFRFLRMGLDEF
jgi:hypothetical protein